MKTEIGPCDQGESVGDRLPDLTLHNTADVKEIAVKDESESHAVEPSPVKAEKKIAFKKRGRPVGFKVAKKSNNLVVQSKQMNSMREDEPEYFCDECPFGSKKFMGLVKHRKNTFYKLIN